MERSEVVGKCERCGKKISEHDSFETIDDKPVCLECYYEESYLEDEDD